MPRAGATGVEPQCGIPSDLEIFSRLVSYTYVHRACHSRGPELCVTANRANGSHSGGWAANSKAKSFSCQATPCLTQPLY
jgi:hypothetical protein